MLTGRQSASSHGPYNFIQVVQPNPAAVLAQYRVVFDCLHRWRASLVDYPSDEGLDMDVNKVGKRGASSVEHLFAWTLTNPSPTNKTSLMEDTTPSSEYFDVNCGTSWEL